MENNIAVAAPPSERSIEIAATLYDNFEEVTNEIVIESARKIDAALSDERETIIGLRSEVVRLLGVIPTQTFLGKPLDHWVQLVATVERLYDSGRREQRLRMSSEASAKRWLDMLKEIAQIPTGKIPEESIAQAVTRYVGELQAMVGEVRKAFRVLCDKNNIMLPCDSFMGTKEDEDDMTCGKCDHPWIVHDPMPQLLTPPDVQGVPLAAETKGEQFI